MNHRTGVLVAAIAVVLLVDGCSSPAPVSKTFDQSSLDLPQLKKLLKSKDLAEQVGAAKRFLYAGRQRPLREDEIKAILPILKSKADWQVKRRLVAALPSAADKTLVMSPLIDTLQSRDVSSTTRFGTLQACACQALVDIGDPQALPVIREWLTYLESNPQLVMPERDGMIEQAKQGVTDLEKKTTQTGTTSNN